MWSDLIMLFIIIFSIVSFVLAFLWKKKYFVKELYVDQPIILLCAYIFIVAVEVLFYLAVLRGQESVYIYALVSAVLDFFLLLMFIPLITTCVYLKNNVLVYKNIFIKKEIDLTDKDIIVKKKPFKTIIIHGRVRITINIRQLVGRVNSLLYEINKSVE